MQTTAYSFFSSFFLPILLAQLLTLQNITFSIKNDSENTIVLHTEKATMSIQSNTSYKFTKPIGTQIFLVEFGEKTTLLLTVKQNMQDKKLNFLDLIKKE